MTDLCTYSCPDVRNQGEELKSHRKTEDTNSALRKNKLKGLSPWRSSWRTRTHYILSVTSVCWCVWSINEMVNHGLLNMYACQKEIKSKTSDSLCQALNAHTEILNKNGMKKQPERQYHLLNLIVSEKFLSKSLCIDMSAKCIHIHYWSKYFFMYLKAYSISILERLLIDHVTLKTEILAVENSAV